MVREYVFKCPSCGDNHKEMPLHFHAPCPNVWMSATEEERAKGKCSLDTCTIKKQYFIKGLLEIPVAEHKPAALYWGVWVGVTEEVFKRFEKIWLRGGREKEKPFKGELANSLPGSESDTVGLKVKVTIQPVGKRPFVSLEPCEDPWYNDQKSGINLDKLKSLVSVLVHNKTLQTN